MGKRNKDETEEEKQARKRAKKEAKKEAKKAKKEAKRQSTDSHQAAAEDTPAGTITAVTVLQSEEKSTQKLSKKASPYKKKRLKMVVSLYPSALGNVMSNVKRSLRSLLLKYYDSVGGVLLAFDNEKLVGDKNGTRNLGTVLGIMPHIHYYVELDALVFCPAEGIQLTGTVNECYPSHVGMLVGSFFNAMVPSDHLATEGYVFDQDLQQWLRDTEKEAKVIGIGDKVTFTVGKLRECAGIISLEGSHPAVAEKK